MNQKSCKKRGSISLYTESKGNNTGLYCSDCGAWIKWLSKDEIRAFEHGQRATHVKIQYKYHEYTIKQLCAYTQKLEQLLKKATEDIKTAMKFNNSASCKVCSHYDSCQCDGICTIKNELRKWRYADEVAKILEEKS